jgi:hypothetical protein
MTYSDEIKSRLTAREVFEFYGFSVNRGGFCLSPFSGEKTPSCKVYDGTRGWYDFSSNRGGDIIDFVRLYFGLPFPTACEKLNVDFQLGLPIGKQHSRQEQIAAQRKAEEQRRQAEQAAAQQAAQQIPVLQKPEADPVAGPQGQRIRYYDPEIQSQVQRRGEGLTPEDARAWMDPVEMTRQYSAIGPSASINDPIMQQAYEQRYLQQLDSLRTALGEKQADIAAGREIQPEYNDWDQELVNRMKEASLQKQLYFRDPSRYAYATQFEREHFHG